MTAYDAVVVGGGINGLTAATVLARQGKSVCLLEAADHLGGMAAPHADGTARIAHLLYNLSPAVRKDIGLGTRQWPFQGAALPTVSLCDDGRHVVLRGQDAQWSDSAAHADAATCKQLLTRMTRYGDLLRQLAEAPPPGLDGPLTSRASLKELLRLGKLGIGLKRLGKTEMRHFLRLLLSNAYDMVLDEMPDGPLAGLLLADATRGASTGPRSPGTVFNLIYRMGHGGAASVPVGGMKSVVDAFATAARNAGVQIEIGAKVRSFQMRDDTIIGAETEDGRSFDAPLVLTSTGAEATCHLAGPGQFDIEATRRFRNVRARGTAAKVNLRLRAMPDIPGLGRDLHHARLVYAPSADYVERAFNPAKYREMASEPVIEAVMSPAAAGAVTLSAIVQHAPYDLDGGWTDRARSALLDHTLGTLAKTMPGITDLVTQSDILSPADIARETGAPGGHWHHAEMSLDQLLNIRPTNGVGRYAFGPKGLFLCGASAHPGGDIMGLAGRNAALAALQSEARR